MCQGISCSGISPRGGFLVRSYTSKKSPWRSPMGQAARSLHVRAAAQKRTRRDQDPLMFASCDFGRPKPSHDLSKGSFLSEERHPKSQVELFRAPTMKIPYDLIGRVTEDDSSLETGTPWSRGTDEAKISQTVLKRLKSPWKPLLSWYRILRGAEEFGIFLYATKYLSRIWVCDGVCVTS